MVGFRCENRRVDLFDFNTATGVQLKVNVDYEDLVLSYLVNVYLVVFFFEWRSLAGVRPGPFKLNRSAKVKRMGFLLSYVAMRWPFPRGSSSTVALSISLSMKPVHERLRAGMPVRI